MLRFFLLVWFSVVALQSVVCATDEGVPGGGNAPSVSHPGIEEKWGVKVLSIRLSAGGFMLDFRYRVIDPKKAAYLTDQNIKPYLVDEASGTKCYVPSYPKTGSLRAKGNPEAGRTYFMLFANPRGAVKKGNKVTVVIGDLKIENLTVE